MRSLIRAYPTETRLFLVLAAISIVLSFAAPSFATLPNLTSLLNNNAVNVIWAVGLLVVLIAGVNVALMQGIAFGWMGLMAGIGGLMQAHIVKEVVPNALYGRELDVLAAVVLGGARLGGGRGSVIGCLLGVALVAVTQNGLNLRGVSPYAIKRVIGLVILAAISGSNLDLHSLLRPKREGR